MESTTPSPATGTPPPEPLPASVAQNGTAPDNAGMENQTVHAAESVIQFDGLKGGRGRRDGLTPGSAEAAEMDRCYDRIRKWQRNHPGEVHPEEKDVCPAMRDVFASRRGDVSRIVAAENREQAKPRPQYLRQPGLQPLPSMPVVAETPGSESGGVESLATVAAAALDAWTGTDLQPVLAELVKVIQDIVRLKREREMMLVGLPPSEAKKILGECAWPEGLENLFCKSTSRLCAKLLNSANVPIAYKDEIIAGTVSLTVLSVEIRNSMRIAKLLAELKKNPPPIK